MFKTNNHLQHSSSIAQVYDAKTKQWTTIDQRKHTDVLEKLSYLEESSGRNELNESERVKNLQSIDTVVSNLRLVARDASVINPHFVCISG